MVQHIWGGTGNTGNELDLASLVCNRLGNDQCINPMKGTDGGSKPGITGDLDLLSTAKLKNVER